MLLFFLIFTANSSIDEKVNEAVRPWNDAQKILNQIIADQRFEINNKP
tara:strand:- start:1461 stop:1604 length:144 start_codon:yes stop_codon:yes gene_type:complete